MLKHLIRRITGRDLIGRQATALDRLDYHNRITLALARAAATAATRQIDLKNPESWEFSGFSQHGEDGIVDTLCGSLIQPNQFFVEIGASDGTQNCSSWLAIARNFDGLMIEGNAEKSARCQTGMRGYNWGVHCQCRYVDRENIAGVMKMCPHRDPDFFSLDIDGIDFYIAQAILEAGYRPKIWAVEYNSALGPERAITVAYRLPFDRWREHASGLYYGVSVAGWRALFGRFGYTFVTVERSGTNAFFIDPAAFPAGFSEGLASCPFRENLGDLNPATRPARDAHGDWVLPRRDWTAQSALIRHLEWIDVE